MTLQNSVSLRVPLVPFIAHTHFLHLHSKLNKNPRVPSLDQQTLANTVFKYSFIMESQSVFLDKIPHDCACKHSCLA